MSGPPSGKTRALNEGMGWGPGPTAWIPGPREVHISWIGRTPSGQRWAYLTWLDQGWSAGITPGAGPTVVLCTGTVPLWSLTRLPDQDYGPTAMPVLTLPVDPERWPDPAVEWAAANGWQLRRAGLMGYSLADRRGVISTTPSQHDGDTGSTGGAGRITAAELMKSRGKRETGRTLADRAAEDRSPPPPAT